MADWGERAKILWRHFKFFLSRQLNYPLVAPDMLQLCFLFRCNLQCAMCSMRERAVKVREEGLGGELPTGLIKDLVVQASEMGVRQLFLLGGEPFLREDIFEIIRFANGRGLPVTVTTNGTLLDDPRIAREIIDSKLHNLSISIDGACESTYASIRGKGLLEKILRNIRLIQELKGGKGALPHIGVFCTIMDQNIGELPEIVRLARSLDVEGIGFQPVVADNTDLRVRGSASPLWVPPERYGVLDASIDALVRYKLESAGNARFLYTGLGQLLAVKQYFRSRPCRQVCYAGFNRIIISQDGKMYFCAEEPERGDISFGNVYTDRLRDLWFSRKAGEFRASIRRCSKPCLLACARRGEFDTLMDVMFHCRRKGPAGNG